MGGGTRVVRGALCAAILAALSIESAPAITIRIDDGSDSASATGCTLRGALSAVNSQAFQTPDPCSAAASGSFGQSDTLQFAPQLVNSTISLQQGALQVSVAMDIQGSGQTIDAGGQTTALGVYCSHTPTCTTRISGVKVTNAVSSYSSAAIVVINASDVTFDNVTVTNNTGSDAWSAGINVGGSHLTLNNCTITQNTNVASTTYLISAGAGVTVSGATLDVNNSTISGNHFLATGAVSSLAGGIAAEFSTLRIVNSTIALNNVDSVGPRVAGGILSETSDVRLSNVTVTENVGKGSDVVAGGILFGAKSASVNTTVELRNATVSGNSVNTAGGGAAGIAFASHYPAAAFSATIANSIVSANASPGPDLGFVNGLSTSIVTLQSDLFGSAMQGVVSGTNLSFNDAPGLAGLANNGGVTQTMALSPTSPAVGAGSATLAKFNGAPLQYDQRGVGYARAFSGTTDLGAFQTQGDRVFSAAFDVGP